MPGDHIHDEIRYKPKAERLYLRKLRIGKTQITSAHDGAIEVATSLQLYIPIPQKHTDSASWFFSISNRKGSCFAKISQEDLDNICEMLLEARTSNDGLDALKTAQIRIMAIKKALAIIEDSEKPPTPINDLHGYTPAGQDCPIDHDSQGIVIKGDIVSESIQNQEGDFITRSVSIESGEILQDITQPDSLMDVPVQELIEETKVRKKKKKDKNK